MKTASLSAMLLLAVASRSHAQPPATDGPWLPLFLPGPLSLPAAPAAPIQDVRVLVYPHLGTYSVPQGAESEAERVKLTSTGTCRMLPRSSDPADPSAPALATGSSFDFEASKLEAPVWVDCAGSPVTVRRETALRSFSYTGRFLVRRAQTPQGKLVVQVINGVPFEQYLQGVVPTEVPASWPPEALKAQAIAARTYAAFEITAMRAQGDTDPDLDLDDTVRYQAYLGLSKATPATDQAVNATAGQIVTWQDQPIKAYFSGDSGGYTEASGNVWGDDLPYCVAKKEQYPADAVLSDWNLVLPQKTILGKLQERGLIPYGVEIQDLQVRDSERFESGRASRVWLTMGDGVPHPVPAFDFRLALGLRSTLFRVERIAGSSAFRLIGRGWGHGVGLSQEGTRALADKLGWSAGKILAFYYEGTRIGHLAATR